MAKIKAGFRLHVVDGEGVLQGTVQLQGFDLEKPLPRMALAEALQDALPATAFESESKTEEG